MKKNIFYISTLVLAVFAINLAKPYKTGFDLNGNTFEHRKGTIIDNAPFSKSNFNSFLVLAVVEDNFSETESQLPYLTNGTLDFNLFLFNNNHKLYSTNYSKEKFYRFNGIPIYKALRNFRI